MTKEGLMGMAMVGGAALAIGGIIGVGMALAKRWSQSMTLYDWLFTDL